MCVTFWWSNNQLTGVVGRADKPRLLWRRIRTSAASIHIRTINMWAEGRPEEKRLHWETFIWPRRRSEDRRPLSPSAPCSPAHGKNLFQLRQRTAHAPVSCCCMFAHVFNYCRDIWQKNQLLLFFLSCCLNSAHAFARIYIPNPDTAESFMRQTKLILKSASRA